MSRNFNIWGLLRTKQVQIEQSAVGSWQARGRLPGLLVLCGESVEDLREIVGRFAEVCRRRGLKINAGKNKVIVQNGKEGLECEIHVDGIRLEHVSKFKYLGCFLDESGSYGAECSRKVASGRRVAGTIRFLVNARDLQLE